MIRGTPAGHRQLNVDPEMIAPFDNLSGRSHLSLP
jgi:hypothetical protein